MCSRQIEFLLIVILLDYSVASGAHIIDYIGGRTSGTIEWWMVDTSTASDPINMFFEDGYLSGNRIHISYLTDGWISYYDGTWHPLQTYVRNYWNHFSLEFDTIAGNFDLKIDGITMVTDGSFEGTVGAIDYVHFTTGGGYSSIHYYLDALSYDWDPNYNIGDNANPNEVLSLRNDGWDTTTSPGTQVSIFDDGIRHGKILGLVDNSASRSPLITNEFEAGQVNGTVEFWAKTSVVGKRSHFKLYNQGGSQSVEIQFDGNTFRYYNGSTLMTDQSITQFNWYHIVIVFDCETDTYDLYLDGNLIAAGINFRYSATTLNSFGAHTRGNQNGYTTYIDAVSYSWEGEYIPTGIAGVIGNITLNTNGGVEPILYYSLKATESAPVFLKLFNFNTGIWETIDYGIFSDFDQNTYALSSPFIDSATNDVICRIVSYSGTSIYSLRLDELRIEATRATTPEASIATISKSITNSFIKRNIEAISA